MYLWLHNRSQWGRQVNHHSIGMLGLRHWCGGWGITGSVVVIRLHGEQGRLDDGGKRQRDKTGGSEQRPKHICILSHLINKIK